jgi:hypothetical protein
MSPQEKQKPHPNHQETYWMQVGAKPNWNAEKGLDAELVWMEKHHDQILGLIQIRQEIGP